MKSPEKGSANSKSPEKLSKKIETEKTFFDTSLIGKVKEGLLAVALKMVSPQWRFEPILTYNGRVSTPDHVLQKVINIDGKQVLVQMILDSKMQDSEKNRNQVYDKYAPLFKTLSCEHVAQHVISVKILGVASLLPTEGEYATLMFNDKDIIFLGVQSSDLLDMILHQPSEQMALMITGGNAITPQIHEYITVLQLCLQRLESIKRLAQDPNFSFPDSPYKREASQQIDKLVSYLTIWSKDLSHEYLAGDEFSKKINTLVEGMQNLTNNLNKGSLQAKKYLLQFKK